MKKKILSGIMVLVLAVAAIPALSVTSFAAESAKEIKLGDTVTGILTVKPTEDKGEFKYPEVRSETYVFTASSDMWLESDYKLSVTGANTKVVEELEYVRLCFSKKLNEDGTLVGFKENDHEGFDDFASIGYDPDFGSQVLIKVKSGEKLYFQISRGLWDEDGITSTEGGDVNISYSFNLKERQLKDLKNCTLTCENTEFTYSEMSESISDDFGTKLKPHLTFADGTTVDLEGGRYEWPLSVKLINSAGEVVTDYGKPGYKMPEVGTYTLVLYADEYNWDYIGEVSLETPITISKSGIRFLPKTRKLKASALKKKAAKITCEVMPSPDWTTEDPQYTVKAKDSKSKKALKIGKFNKKGYFVITVKKGTKKGTYKVVVTQKETNNYKKASQVVTIKVK